VPGPQIAQPRVLVVEDNPSDIYLLRLAFQQAGLSCDFTEFEDGAMATAYIRQYVAESIPHHLIILDLNLPRRSGMEVLKELRAHPSFSSVTVAILSSSSSPREQAAIQEFDNVHFFTKPPTLDEFLGLGSELGKLMLTPLG
jgi:chemotaxis family two-component system response regulator Rcp1